MLISLYSIVTRGSKVAPAEEEKELAVTEPVKTPVPFAELSVIVSLLPLLPINSKF